MKKSYIIYTILVGDEFRCDGLLADVSLDEGGSSVLSSFCCVLENYIKKKTRELSLTDPRNLGFKNIVGLEGSCLDGSCAVIGQLGSIALMCLSMAANFFTGT